MKNTTNREHMSSLGSSGNSSLPPGRVRHGRHAALAVLIVAVLGWLLLAQQLISDGPLMRLDDTVAQWAHGAAQPGVTAFFLGLSALHTLPPLLTATLLIAAWLWRRGERVWSWLLPLALAGGACLNMVLKEWLQRERPAYSGLARDLHSFSFPSGHAAHATIFYGVLALLAWQTLRWRPTLRVLACGAAVLMGLLVMSGRVVLGVHYLADITAGLLVGLAWLGLVLFILAPEPARALPMRHRP